MKEKIKCTIRYSILALVTGVAVGAIDTIFGRGLLWLSDFRTAHYRYLLPFLPVAGLLIVWMYHRFSEESLKGMTLVLETGQKKRKSIPLALVPLVIVGTWLTHLFGGSAGREGVAVQIGAVISHEAGKKFRCPENDRIMLVAGMAAGFGGQEAKTYIELANKVSYLSMSSEGEVSEIDLCLKDKDVNALKQIVDFAKQFAGM